MNTTATTNEFWLLCRNIHMEPRYSVSGMGLSESEALQNGLENEGYEDEDALQTEILKDDKDAINYDDYDDFDDYQAALDKLDDEYHIRDYFFTLEVSERVYRHLQEHGLSKEITLDEEDGYADLPSEEEAA